MTRRRVNPADLKPQRGMAAENKELCEHQEPPHLMAMKQTNTESGLRISKAKKGFVVNFKRENGRITYFDQNGKVLSSKVDRLKDDARGWREIMRSITYNGLELMSTLRGLANGEPMAIAGETVYPSIDVVVKCNTFLLEFMLGKAVSQAEVLLADADASQVSALEKMSDSELRERLLQMLASERREEVAGSKDQNEPQEPEPSDP